MKYSVRKDFCHNRGEEVVRYVVKEQDVICGCCGKRERYGKDIAIVHEESMAARICDSLNAGGNEQ